MRRIPRAAWVTSSAFALVYAAYAMQLHHQVRTTAYDLGIFDQAMRGYAGLGAPVVPLKAPGLHLLGDHFHPVLIILTPLYWVWDDPRMLLLAQAVLIAASIPAVWRFSARALGDRAAPWVAVAYGLAWGLQSMVAFDFHELAFAVPLTAWALERMQAERWRSGTLCVLALLLVKEDLAMLVVAFGVYAFIRGQRRLGVGLTVGGLVAYEVITKVFIPHFSGGAPFVYWTYTALGDDLPSAVWFLVRHPLRSLRIFVTPGAKRSLLLWLLAPTFFLSLLSPILVLTLPVLGERLFSSNPNHWGTGFHYNAVLMPIVVCAAVEGLARVRPWLPDTDRDRVVRRVTMGFALAAALVTYHFPFHELWHTKFWQLGERAQTKHRVVALIPDGASVAATNEVAPQLTRRAEVFLLDGEDYGQDWAVFDIGRLHYPFTDIGQPRAYLRRLTGEGWQVVLNERGFVVLRRPSQ